MPDAEDATVDFSNAALYLSGLQTIFSVVAIAVVSVLSCWINDAGVSAVRTLALCSLAGAALMRKPLRVGRARGIQIVFASLQPAVPLYIVSLVVEQLVHACAVDAVASPSWRRVVFHGMLLAMLVSGFLRARQPLRDSDAPFLLTMAALLVVALLPPPSVALTGPLCQSVSGWAAAERCVRSFAFAVLYSTHVYASTSGSSPSRSESMIVVTRSAAASLWVLGAHVLWLPLAVAQCVLVIHMRLSIDGGAYKSIDAATPAVHAQSDDDDGGDLEAARAVAAAAAAAGGGAKRLPEPQHADPLEEQRRLLKEAPRPAHAVDALFADVVGKDGVGKDAEPEEEPRGLPAVGPLRFRELTPPPPEEEAGGAPTGAPRTGKIRAADMTPSRMEQIVSSLEDCKD